MACLGMGATARPAVSTPRLNCMSPPQGAGLRAPIGRLFWVAGPDPAGTKYGVCIRCPPARWPATPPLG
eukprot:4301974-Lingulodinium_polyedra.AAC.1